MTEEDRFIRYLMDFGLSRQEALVYRELLSGGKQSGYEIAKEAGISRSNAYTTLAALVEKGAAYLVEESAKRYIPVSIEEFCGNRLRRMEGEREWLMEISHMRMPARTGISRLREKRISETECLISWTEQKSASICRVLRIVLSRSGHGLKDWPYPGRRSCLSQTQRLKFRE